MNVKRFKLDFKALLLVAAQKSQHDTKCEPRGLASALLNQQLRSEMIDGRSTIWGAGCNAEKQAVVLTSRPGSPEGRYDLAAQDVLIPFESLDEIVVEIPCEITGEGPMFAPVDVRWHEVPAPLKNAKKEDLWTALGERDSQIAELKGQLEEAKSDFEALDQVAAETNVKVGFIQGEVERLRSLVAHYEAIQQLKEEAPVEEVKAEAEAKTETPAEVKTEEVAPAGAAV